MASNRRRQGRNFSGTIFEPVSNGLYEKCVYEVSGGVKQRMVRTGIFYEVLDDDNEDIVQMFSAEDGRPFRIKRMTGSRGR